MSAPFVIRHYIPETDLSPLSRMLTEIESIDRDGEDTSEESLRAALEWPNYHPDQNVWVAETNGKLVGYGVALKQPDQRCTIYIVVHPIQRRKGLGSKLLELGLTGARETGSKAITIYANGHNIASNMFLKQHGFVAVGSSWVMRAPVGIKLENVNCPEGYRLRSYAEVRHFPTLLEIVNQGYRGMWGHGQYSEATATEDSVKSGYLQRYGLDGIFLLYAPTGKVIGFCGARSEAKQDEQGNPIDLLDAPGVIQEYRDQEYQRLLVLAAIHWLRQRGQRPVMLESWGDNEQAIAIYREVGFELLQYFIAYHKEL